MQTPVEIVKEKIVFNDKLVIEEGKLSAKGKTFSRLKVNRENASAVLILNTDTNKVILTKQFRYAIASKVAEPILEIVAGKADGDEDPFQTARREAEEEVGYRISEANTKLLLSCFPTPGYSSEQFFVYYATVTNADKVSEGGGLEEENESIEVVEMPLDKFINLIRDGMIKDAKTYIAGMHMILQWH